MIGARLAKEEGEIVIKKEKKSKREGRKQILIINKEGEMHKNYGKCYPYSHHY